ncbi:uncharacterized protein LOC143565495 [Bidens hawaiensis]|uniref:uncharacterized protein LOC143565495 n=1 Tax=Bidens hawaiensis TaxID=980011 RepID=UPI00404960F8
MLTVTNYIVWAMRIKVVLKVRKVWDTIGLGLLYDEKNDLTIARLFQSIRENLIMQVDNQETAKDMWDAIKSYHLGADRVREARLQTLTTEFDNLKMRDSESIDDFAGKLSSLASKSAALGEEIKGTKMVKKFLKNFLILSTFK